MCSFEWVTKNQLASTDVVNYKLQGDVREIPAMYIICKKMFRICIRYFNNNNNNINLFRPLGKCHVQIVSIQIQDVTQKGKQRRKREKCCDNNSIELEQK